MVVVITDDVGLAWTLASVAHRCLGVSERHDIYIAIGVGETFAAIDSLLTHIAGARLALPADIIATAGMWLDGYIGHPDEPRLRELISRIKPSQATAGAGDLCGYRGGLEGDSRTCGLCGRTYMCALDPVSETWLCDDCHDEHRRHCHGDKD